MLEFVSIQRKDNHQWAIPGVRFLFSLQFGAELLLAAYSKYLLLFFACDMTYSFSSDVICKFFGPLHWW